MTVLPVVAVDLEDLLAELSRILWKQRELIDTLQYRLEVQQLMSISPRADRLQTAVDEVAVAMEDLRRSERDRDLVVRRCAAAMQLADTASLGEIRAEVGEPWATTLADHQQALLALVGGAERLSAMNRELAAKGAQNARAMLTELTGSKPASAYGPTSGRTTVAASIVNWDV